MAKMHLVPIRRGYWGKNSGLPHTIPMKLSGTCGSVSVRLIPAPRGTGLVAAPASKKILAYLAVSDYSESSSDSILILTRACQTLYPTQYGGPRGLLLDDARPLAHHGQFHHRGLQRCLGLVRLSAQITLGRNFGCRKQVFSLVDVAHRYGYLSPELWKPTVFSKAPFQEHTDFLAKEAESAKADAAY